jgi:hypothetical protein
MVTIYVDGQLAQFMNHGNFINQFYPIDDSNMEDLRISEMGAIAV